MEGAGLGFQITIKNNSTFSLVSLLNNRLQCPFWFRKKKLNMPWISSRLAFAWFETLGSTSMQRGLLRLKTKRVEYLYWSRFNGSWNVRFPRVWNVKFCEYIVYIYEFSWSYLKFLVTKDTTLNFTKRLGTQNVQNKAFGDDCKILRSFWVVYRLSFDEC